MHIHITHTSKQISSEEVKDESSVYWRNEITGDCTLRALEKAEVFHLNRGSRKGAKPEGVVTLKADINIYETVSRLIKDMYFDSVVNG